MRLKWLNNVFVTLVLQAETYLSNSPVKTKCTRHFIKQVLTSQGIRSKLRDTISVKVSLTAMTKKQKKSDSINQIDSHYF